MTDPSPPLRRVFVRDLVLQALLGVYPHELDRRQPIRINLDLGVIDNGLDYPQGIGPDELDRVVDYDSLTRRVRRLVQAEHIALVETLAERLAVLCLVDKRVISVRLRVEKLTVFADAASAGVEIERSRQGFSTSPSKRQ
jgi:dihydroneopterin aldolase